MSYKKILGLLAVAAAALMAFAGTASATLTSPAGTTYSGTFHASSEGATSFTGDVTVTCNKSTLGGNIVTDDATIGTVLVQTFTLEECGPTVTVVNKGTISINNSGQVFSTGAEITVQFHTIFLDTLHCIFKTDNTEIGELTDSNKTKSTATIDVERSIPVVVTEGPLSCGTATFWEGSYKISTPDTMIRD